MALTEQQLNAEIAALSAAILRAGTDPVVEYQSPSTGAAKRTPVLDLIEARNKLLSLLGSVRGGTRNLATFGGC